MKVYPGIAALLLVAMGCFRPPAALRVGTFTEIDVRDAQQTDQRGTHVRWGGTIVHVQAKKSGTCFEVVSRPLDLRARPRRTDQTDGRFLACHGGFFDPEVYSKSREITVIGTLQDVVEEKVDEYDYRFPKLDAEVVYLWPRRDEPALVYGPGPYYWDPWIWGPAGYPWYYRRGPYRYRYW